MVLRTVVAVLSDSYTLVYYQYKKCMPGTSYNNIVLTVGASGHPSHVNQSGFATDGGQLVPRALAATSLRELRSASRVPTSTAKLDCYRRSYTALVTALRGVRGVGFPACCGCL